MARERKNALFLKETYTHCFSSQLHNIVNLDSGINNILTFLCGLVGLTLGISFVNLCDIIYKILERLEKTNMCCSKAN